MPEWTWRGGIAAQGAPRQSVGHPGEGQQHHKQSGIGRNLQIEVDVGVDQDRQHPHKAAIGQRPEVRMVAMSHGTDGSEQGHQHQGGQRQAPNDARFQEEFQIIVVGMIREFEP